VTPLDALIIGAGPAGSAAAIELARGGVQVALVDRRSFPRDKTCGDALIPDALAMLDRLGLSERVLSRARVVNAIRVYAPNGRSVTIRGRSACIPRTMLDDILRCEAIRAGATFFPGYKLHAPIADRVVRGAAFASTDGNVVDLRAETTILATGAAAEALQAFGVCERASPSAMAARMYVAVDDEVWRAFDHLCISYDKEICPGYGWVFPGLDNTFNIGVGYFYDAAARPPETHVRRLFERFVNAFPPAREVMLRSRQRSPLKGAPLRTALEGAALGRPGLLVVGEAAGLTYSFSGEGIGKAMESGVMAARAILARSAADRSSPDAVAERYAKSVRDAFASRFRAYKAAQDWLSRPSAINLLAWQANRSRFAMEQLEGMFQETVAPERLFSPAGMLRSLIS
jgi:geranylgeranyl reductase family protein